MKDLVCSAMYGKATEELTLVAIVLCIKQLQILATVDYYQVLPLRL